MQDVNSPVTLRQHLLQLPTSSQRAIATCQFISPRPQKSRWKSPVGSGCSKGEIAVDHWHFRILQVPWRLPMLPSIFQRVRQSRKRIKAPWANFVLGIEDMARRCAFHGPFEICWVYGGCSKPQVVSRVTLSILRSPLRLLALPRVLAQNHIRILI